MGGFTRLLHSGQADDLMEEVPTYVAQVGGNLEVHSRSTMYPRL